MVVAVSEMNWIRSWSVERSLCSIRKILIGAVQRRGLDRRSVEETILALSEMNWIRKLVG